MVRLSSFSLALALLKPVASTDPVKVDGTCGKQCTEAAECHGCGTDGACSCPDGKAPFYQTSCSCVSAPGNPPKDPAADVSDSVWPDQWTANLNIYNYKDFSDAVQVAGGKFYFDGTRGKSRIDWTVGKSGKQVWIGSGPGSSSSDYYATIGPICLKFHITDPGQPGKPMIGLEYADWMKRCGTAGLAKYVGREQVHVDGEDVWVDHYSCRLDYINSMTNQSVTFQNWHSLGLGGKYPKGLPMRVTGGNSKPDPNQAPRMNNVWYSNFVTGPTSTKDDDFKPLHNPFGLPCTPLMGAAVEEFFGHKVLPEHVISPDFQRRAHFLPHAIMADEKDLKRARRPKPSSGFTGSSFGDAMHKLNNVLLSETGLKTQSCDNFTTDLLHEMQRLLFDARTTELDNIYTKAGDTRRMAHSDLAALKKEQADLLELKRSDSPLAGKAQDGACHEMVMWYVHHLSASAREEVKEFLVLPLLPSKLHEAPQVAAAQPHEETHRRYSEQASCAICHVSSAATEAPVVV